VETIFEEFNIDLSASAIFNAFVSDNYSVFLDNSLNSSTLLNYSYITSDPFLIITSKGNNIKIKERETEKEFFGNPFNILNELIDKYNFDDNINIAPFQGGAIGYMSYEMRHHIEHMPSHALDYLELPEMCFGFYDWVISINHSKNTTTLISTILPNNNHNSATNRIEWVKNKIKNSSNLTKEKSKIKVGKLKSNFSEKQYLDSVRKVKYYIEKGDVYQVNIAQRFEIELEEKTWDLYKRLRQITPSNYSAFLRYPESDILSTSPEHFVSLKESLVHSKPMKGTRPRGSNKKSDNELLNDLKNSLKDRTENLMIVDVVRNDLGKVCLPGSINVKNLFKIEKYEHVFQMITDIYAELNDKYNIVDLLESCFPGGSVTGAPKIRAMEIIDEIEPVQRNVYCGAIGYFGFNGNMKTSIPIRTMIVKNNIGYFHVGGGIIYDSNPSMEYQETLDKAKGFFKALNIIN